MIAQYGADIVRLWALLSDYSEDVRISKDTIKKIAAAIIARFSALKSPLLNGAPAGSTIALRQRRQTVKEVT